MYKINNLLKQSNIKANRYVKKNNTYFIDTNNSRYVVKKNNINNEIRQYLNSRKFYYYPKTIKKDENYEIEEYLEDYKIPKEQKILDMIDLVSLLHSKTTHYKEINEDEYKEIYEDINNNIEYLYSYYTDIITIIESKVYMSPSEYYLARNIGEIYRSLEYSKKELEEWYQIVKEKQKKRLVIIHNDLKLDHFIRNNNSYLVSWDKSRIDIPIFDLYKLYKRHALEFDFREILKKYEHNYPLLKEEKKLLFILITLPEKIEFNKTEYLMSKEVTKLIDYMYKTKNLVLPNYFKETKKK